MENKSSYKHIIKWYAASCELHFELNTIDEKMVNHECQQIQ